MAATEKTELEKLTAKEFDKLDALLRTIDADAAKEKDEEDTSIKDVVGHRAHWIDLFFGWYADGMAGKKVAFPAPGYKWNELKRYNADLRKNQADMDWTAALAMLRDRHRRLFDWMREAQPGRALWRADEGREQRLDPGALGRSGRPQPLPFGAQIHPLATEVSTVRTARVSRSFAAPCASCYGRAAAPRIPRNVMERPG